jgi:hypothetical protein
MRIKKNSFPIGVHYYKENGKTWNKILELKYWIAIDRRCYLTMPCFVLNIPDINESKIPLRKYIIREDGWYVINLGLWEYRRRINFIKSEFCFKSESYKATTLNEKYSKDCDIKCSLCSDLKELSIVCTNQPIKIANRIRNDLMLLDFKIKQHHAKQIED